MKKIILTDIDDCIVDWRTAFSDWIHIYHPNLPKKTSSIHENFHVLEWLDIERSFERSLITHFNQNYLRSLQPLWDAKKYINENSDKYDFIGISAVTYETNSYNDRWFNLNQHFPNAFKGLFHVGLGESKIDYLEKFKPTVWVEDNNKNAIDGYMLGHTTFIRKTKYTNKDLPSGIHVINSWYDIFDYLNKNT